MSRKKKTAVKDKKKSQEEKKYLKDRAAIYILSNELYLSTILKLILKDIIKDFDFKKMDVRVNKKEMFKDGTIDVGVETCEARIDVEVNYNSKRSTENKNLSYVAHLLVNQTKHDKDYDYTNLKKVIQINIDNYDVFKKKKFIYTSALMETTLHEVRNDLILIIDINIDYLYRMGYNRIIRKCGRYSLEHLLYVFACKNKKQVFKAFKGGNEIMTLIRDAISYWEEDEPWLLDNTEEEAFEHGQKVGVQAQKKDDIVNFYQNGGSKELILKSLGITEEYFNDVLEENNIKIRK